MDSRQRLTTILVAFFILFLVATLASVIWDAPLERALESLRDNQLASGAAFTLLMFAATVVAPLTTGPLIPLASGILPPFAVAVLSVIGWGTGAVVAFLIARWLGRPLVLRFVREATLRSYEARIPARLEFLTLVLLRMVLPVDVLSYAVGVLSTISLTRYTLATFIGITPFAFVFAYGGAALWKGEYATLVTLSVAGIALFTLVYILVRRRMRDRRKLDT